MNHMTPARTVDDLIEQTSSGFRRKFLFFWGHTPTKDGTASKACFSQWWEAPFEIDGTIYPTAEHYMMAAKARLFGDEVSAAKIVGCGSPKQAKAFGRGVAGFDDETWTRQRFKIVVAANLAKFSQNPPLREFLLQTGNRVLVEASPVDRIWGIGLAGDDARADKPHEWRGLNLLGFALMEVRETLSGSQIARS